MAGNIFAQNPLSVALDEGRKRRAMTMQERGIGPQADQAPAPSFDGISSQYQVPVNILMSMSEASGLQGNDALSFADQQARLIAPRLQAGASVTDALTSIYGDKVPPDAMTAMLDRAKAIGDKLYPVQADPNADPSADPNVDPFAGEGAGALVARRGQQFAAGATDVAAGVPEGLALSSRNVMEQKDKIVSLQASRLSDERDTLNAQIQANGPESERGRSASNRLKVVEFMLGRYDDNTQINEEIRSTPVGETALFQLGQDLRNASENLFGAPDKRDTGLWGQVANGAGNMAGFIAASMLGGVVGGSAGALAAGGATGSALTGSQLYKEAIASGADEETAMEAARWGSLIGASEILPIAHTLKLLPASVRSKILSGISGRVADIVRRGANIAGGAVEEGVQEYLSQVAQNITAQQLYDEDRGWTDGAGEAALVGAILGGGMGVPGAIRSAPPKDDGGGDQGGDNAAPDSSGGFTGLRLTPDQRTDVGMILRPDQRVDGTAAVPAPTGPLGRAAEAGPAPLSTAFDTGQMVNITTDDGMDMNAQFVQETPSGILVTDPADGSQFEIPREEIDSGVTRIGQVVEQSVPEAPMSAAEVTPDAVPAEPAPTSETRAAATNQTPQSDTGPVTMQQEVLPAKVPNSNPDALMPDMARAKERVDAGQPSLGQLAEGMPEPETKRDGTPFASEAAVRQALKNRMLDPLAFDVVPKGDGFVAVSNPTRSPSQAEVELASGFKPKKKPLLNMLKSVGVHPQSPLADELRSMDITPRTAPGLFRWDGAKAWDNLPASEWGDIRHTVGEDGNGYLSEQGLVDALRSEFAGVPSTFEDNAGGDTSSTAAGTASPEIGAPDISMAGRETDLSSDGERFQFAKDLIERYLGAASDASQVTKDIEYRASVILAEQGGYIEDAIFDAIDEGKQANADETGSGIPFPETGKTAGGDQAGAGPKLDNTSAPDVSGGGAESAGTSGSNAGERAPNVDATTDTQGTRTGSLEGGSVDLTPEGQQTVIPGAEKITDKSLAERKMGAPKRGGNAAPDEGGLFGPNGGSLAPDLFDAAPEKAAPAETKRDGSPFATEAAAKQALKNRRLKPEDFEIIPRDGGFVAVARAGEAAPVPKAAQPDIKAAPISKTAPVSDITGAIISEETSIPNKKIAHHVMYGLEFEKMSAEDAARMLKAGGIPRPNNERMSELLDKAARLGGTSGGHSLEFYDVGSESFDKLGIKPYATGELSWAKLALLEQGKLRRRGSFLTPIDAYAEELGTRKTTVTGKEVEQAAAEADTAPTDAQKEAGNYKLGHIDIHGLDVSIENAKGSERSGKDSDGESWSVTMPAAYGYIKKTTGADGDHVDVYIGDNPESDVVVIVDQLDLATGKFDEHKVILGAKNAAEARTIYEGGFSDGKGAERIGGSTEMTVDGFKEWLANGDQTKPAASPKAKGKEKSHKQASTLAKQAAASLDRAEAAMGQDRHANTARRARMARSAIEDANKAKSHAKTAANIADALERSDAGKADTIKSMADVDRADRALKSGQYRRIREGGLGYTESENAKGEPLGAKDVPFISNPNVTVRQGVMRDVLEQSKGLRGLDRSALNAIERRSRGNYAELTRTDDIGNLADALVAIRKKSGKLDYGLTELSKDIRNFRAMQRIYGGDKAEFFKDYLRLRSGHKQKIDPVAVAREGLIGNKIEGFFETPEAVARRMVEMADLKKGDKVLEPSAGGGRLANAAAEVVGKENVDVIERNTTLVDLLRLQGFEPVSLDFMEFDGKGYDAIIMNPPFERRQDAEHLRRALGMLKPGGRLVAITGEGIFFGTDTKAKEFRAWLAENGGTSEKLPEGTFKESGTGTNTRLVTVERAMDAIKDGKQTGQGGSLKNAEVSSAETDAVIKPADVAKNTTTQPNSTNPSTNSEKIEDFGEVLQGAAKHYAATYGKKMKVAGEQDTKEVPLSKSWPVPDYQKLIDEGADPWAVSFARAARDEVPTKPRGRYSGGRLANWVKQVETLRKFSEDVMSGKMSKDKVAHGLMVGGRGLQGVGTRTDLYVAVGHDKSLAGVTLNEANYGVYDGVEHNPPLVMWTVSRAAKATAFGNMPYQLAKGATKEEAIAAFKKNIANIETQPKASKQVRFSVYSYRHRKGFVVGKKIGRQHVDLATFDTKEEARKYLAENEAELVKKLKAFKSIPNERKESNSPRIGEDHRGGVDASAEMFAEAFGFRGVQFGNYVEGAKRQADLNRAYDALMDMAGVLDIPAKAISLNGTLGLAFGARGKGGKGAAAAHFEPDSIVINLTKKDGAGSLAHEWWHAADNYFSRIRKQPSGYLSETPYKTKGRDTDAELRQEIADAFKAVRDAIGKTDMVKRSSELDKRRTKGYWATGRELSARAFEGFIISKLADNGLANDYLANITSEGVWNAEEALSGHEDAKSYPYPTEAEQKAITEAYDALFRAVETKETPTGVAMLSRGEPVAILTGKEFGKELNIRQLQKAARDWYRENLSGTHVTMEQTGWDIQFTNASAKKTTFTHHAELLRVIPALKEILAKGRVVATEEYKGTKKDFRAVHKIAATVEVDGKPRDVIVIVREHKNGHFQYALSRDNSIGARFSKSISNHPERVGGKSKAPDGIFDHADTINLYLDDGNIKEELAELPDKPYRLITNPRFQAKVDEVKIALIEQLKKIGIANKIKVEVAENIMAMTPSGVTVRANGFHFGNTIGIALSGSQMTKDVMNHEAIHALRSPDLWGGKEYGLFTKAEWQALVAHARKDKARMAKVRRVYSDLNTAGQIEEAIADMYAEWADANIQHPTQIEQILQKMQDFFEAIGNALRGNGFRSANDVFRSISEGEIGKRQDLVEGGDVPSRGIKLSKEEIEEISPETEAQSNARYSKALDGAVGSIKGAGPATWKRAMQIARGIKHGDTLTQLMSGDKSSILGFVPGRNLFTELGKALPSAQKYIGIKQEMDAVRSEWHAKTDEVAKKWRKVMWKQSKANKRMMDLMHQSTLAQVDPSKAFETMLTDRDKAVLKAGVGKHKAAYEAAEEKRLLDEQRKIDHGTLVAEFDRLPAGFRRMFAEVRDTYEAMDKEFDKALIENIEKAMEVTVKGHERRHKAEIERISDEGLTGAERAEAVAKADKTLATSKAKARWGNRARVIAMRQKFESNRLVGPYFPLGRFGSFAVTVRDAKTGKVKNFSRFEKASEQTEFAATMRKDKTNNVEVGIIEEQNLKEQVDANFVADIEQILGDAKVDKDVMDSVWQKWLQDYVPELSLRKTNIHRKGIPGYSNDAFRVFGRHVMHGAHQLARLKYGLDLGQALENAAPEARRADDPVRAGLVLEEMRRRHKFTMNPTGAAWATTASSFAFTWYLAMTPAAALVNISQTTVIGIPVLAAYHDGKGGTKAAAAAYEISKASKDFVKGYGTADRGNNLSKDESAAMKEAYRRSTIDATNAHDIAGVAESGVEYSDRRMRVMGALSFLFHHAERFNREVTFLAAYRMARKKGRTHEEAIDVGSDLTWKTHFDYQNTSRPRVMQGDVAKVVLTFRNYQANMIWRLFRDTHQVFKGKSKADKKEALRQLGGMTAMMALHVGTRGTWLFGITMMIAGLFFDEPEEDLKKGAVDLLGNTGASLLLNGIIGTATGTAVSERMGMPDLLFRSSGRDLDGRDEYNYWLTQSLGASFGLVERAFRGVNMMIDGKVWRGIETLAPKFVRDQMKAQRFYEEGALTYRGDPLMEEVDFWDQLKQGLGFTPAALAERYQTNNWMENREKRIRDERSALQTEAGRVIMDGGSLSSELVDNISAFNQENPSYPITRKTVKASIRGRQRASANNEYGTTIIKSLNDVIRREAAPLISQ